MPRPFAPNNDHCAVPAGWRECIANTWPGILPTIDGMFSARFGRPVIVTRHAAQRMAERQVSDDLLLRLIDEGGQRWRDAHRLWVWLDVPGRSDNLVCAVLVLEDAVIVKTVMHRWELMP